MAIGMVWKLMYDPNIGILDYILKSMGMPTVNFLGDSNIALYSLIVVDIWGVDSTGHADCFGWHHVYFH